MSSCDDKTKTTANFDEKINIKINDTKYYLRDYDITKESNFKDKMIKQKPKGIGTERLNALMKDILKINDNKFLEEILTIVKNEITKRTEKKLERTKFEEGSDLTNELSEEEKVELENINENGNPLSENLIDSLHHLYSGSKSDVDFIYYTGQLPESCNNKTCIFTTKEFENYMYVFFSEETQNSTIYYGYNWYHFVVISGANVYWNKKENLITDIIKNEKGDDLTNELSKEEQVELEDISENGDLLSDHLVNSLNSLYSDKDINVDFIYYTAQTPESFKNKNSVFTVNEFEECMYQLFGEEIQNQDKTRYCNYKWYHFVVLSSASVYWNK